MLLGNPLLPINKLDSCKGQLSKHYLDKCQAIHIIKRIFTVTVVDIEGVANLLRLGPPFPFIVISCT